MKLYGNIRLKGSVPIKDYEDSWDIIYGKKRCDRCGKKHNREALSICKSCEKIVDEQVKTRKEKRNEKTYTNDTASDVHGG